MRFVRQALQISRDRAKGKSPVSFPCDGHKCTRGGMRGQEKAAVFSEIDIDILNRENNSLISIFNGDKFIDIDIQLFTINFSPEPPSFEFVDYRKHCLQVDCTCKTIFSL